MAAAQLPEIGLVLGAQTAAQGGDAAPLPHIGLVLSAPQVAQGGDAAPLPHLGLLLTGGAVVAAPVGGYYERAPKPPRKKLTVLHKDDRAEKEAEFDALLAKVSGQAQAKAKEAASKPIEITKPPRMPEIRGVDSFYLRQYLPDLIGTFDLAFQAAYQAEKQAQMDAMAQAQAAIAKAKFEAEEEEIAILALML